VARNKEDKDYSKSEKQLLIPASRNKLCAILYDMNSAIIIRSNMDIIGSKDNPELG